MGCHYTMITRVTNVDSHDGVGCWHGLAATFPRDWGVITRQMGRLGARQCPLVTTPGVEGLTAIVARVLADGDQAMPLASHPSLRQSQLARHVLSRVVT